MSASDKKKLRKEQERSFLTEKQRREQLEAKKLKNYTIVFITSMVLVVCIALGVLGIRAVNNSGVLQKNTIAAIIDSKQLNSVELSYYFNDAVSEYYSDMYDQFSSYTDTYLEVLGLNTKKPLDKQIQDEKTGKTWATYFLEKAIAQAKSDYAMAKLAAADETFELPEDKKTSLENMRNNLEAYAKLYGYKNSAQYLRSLYGYGAEADSYLAYTERAVIAEAYIAAHKDAITYDDKAIREYEEDKFDNYSSFTYVSCYLSYTDFREGGTKDENGNTTYTEEENNAARAALKAAADILATATSIDDLKAKVEATKVIEGKTLSVNESKAVLYTAIDDELVKWLSAKERKDGDITAIANVSTTKDEDGNEISLTNGYTVVIFQSKTENKNKLGNVRHLLVAFEGGTKDENNKTVYSDEEKATAKTTAEGYLKTWKKGDATEATFIELVKEHSDDTSKEEGGLFENIHPDSQYVESFLNWSIDPNRKVGDTEIIESEYGYHIIYFVKHSDLTYRDYMITNEMREIDQEAWRSGIVEKVTGSIEDTSKMELGLILANG
ncbi:MAG: peptidylprolyl isomerase [Oscillospiraceae bacterium]|nr:peptidylprolyl isomerase [Oscillospiraceae bacterium]